MEETMSDVLVRGIPKHIHDRVQKLAKSQNLSINQALIRLLIAALEHMEESTGEEKRRAQALKRLERIRARLHRKYACFDDSAKLIREDRDNR